jgi:long-chain acyl-CoA synthetase
MDAGEANGAQQCCAPTKEEGESGEGVARNAIEGANAGLAEYQRMHRWVPWPEMDFPRTATGKPRLPVIAARARGLLNGQPDAPTGTVAPGSGATSGMGGSSMIEGLLSEISVPSSAANHLERELNLSSLDRVELMSALEEKFHVELSETTFSNAKTVADVERLLRQPAARRSEYVYPRWTQREPARWVRLAVYYALVWPATQILGHPQVVGREHLRNLRGPVLIVSNHVAGRADIGLILAALPAQYRHWLATAMAAETLHELRHAPKDWFFAKRWFYHLGYWLVTLLFNVFPLPKLSGFRESFRFAGESVDRGYSVLIFPEGVINNSETGELAKFQSGAGLLAENLRLPIVPMRLDGVWGMKRERRRLAHLGEITVRIGAPIAFPAGTPADEIARSLESVVRSL